MSSISFNQIPTNLRVPFVYVEFDSTQAWQGPGLFPYRHLVIGQSIAAGTQDELVPVRVTSAEEAKDLFGAGSQLARMLERHFQNNGWTETWAVAIADADAANAAAGTMTFGGPASAAGTISIYVAGRRVRVAVASGDAAAAIATAVAAAINAEADCPVTAAVNGEEDTQVDITAKNKGVSGNDLELRLNYFRGDALPAGVTVAFDPETGTTGRPTPPDEMAAATAAVASYHGNIDPARPFQTLPLVGCLPAKAGDAGMRLAGGTANPDIDEVFAELGDVHYHVITVPWSDAANLVALNTELADRWGPFRMIEGNAIVAAHGTQGELGTLGDSVDSKHITIVNTGGPFTRAESNLLLYDGISTVYDDDGGTVRVQRLVTTYKTNGAGAADIAYLDLNTPLTLGYLRADFRNYILTKYPRAKLKDDGIRAPGQALITPKIGKAEAIARARTWEELGLVENVDAFAEQVICERNAQDPNRLDWMLPPDLVNQFRIGAAQIRFIL
ncbi:MAG: phage tail sheath subtilisin-like domain-containing protein [Tistlia sp.]|uniref:phage tail sheath subtilisin-like domain-containing protein n=1 Tax=Tistlia sp. TaxID=3057121 RepID=UPI0034A4F893